MENHRCNSFEIHIAAEVLADLRQRLNNTRWPCSVEGAGWNAGTDPHYLQEIVAYWQNTHDWRKHEEALNENFLASFRKILRPPGQVHVERRWNILAVALTLQTLELDLRRPLSEVAAKASWLPRICEWLFH